MLADEIKFYEGEKREITAVIHSKNPKDTIVIVEAEYELKKQFGDEILQSGNCEIKGAEATVFLDFELPKGNYTLKIKSSVGREVIISKVPVEIV